MKERKEEKNERILDGSTPGITDEYSGIRMIGRKQIIEIERDTTRSGGKSDIDKERERDEGRETKRKTG